MGLGVFFTGLLLPLMWRLCRELRLGLRGFVLVLAASFGTEPFLQFQTSGLENSLLHCLLGAMLLAAVRQRPGWLFPLGALALLTRPDSVLLTAPLWVWAFRDMRARRMSGLAACIAAALAPLLAWYGFAAIYYGYPLPNTFYGKTTGVVSTTLVNGLLYAGDLAMLRWLAAGALILAAHTAFTWKKNKQLSRPVVAGAWGATLHAAYVILIGGDYMHGRFFTPSLFLALWPAALVIRQRWPATGWRLPGAAMAVAFANFALMPRFTDRMIVNERAGSEGNHFGRLGRLHFATIDGDSPLPFSPTLSERNVGMVLGEDTRLSFIDLMGLTDPYVARCDVLTDDFRPGHIERAVPAAYFRARGDIRLLPRGEERLRSGNATLWPDIEKLRSHPQWASTEQRQRFEELQLLTRGPLWDSRRLALIPRYTFSRQAIGKTP